MTRLPARLALLPMAFMVALAATACTPGAGTSQPGSAPPSATSPATTAPTVAATGAPAGPASAAGAPAGPASAAPAPAAPSGGAAGTSSESCTTYAASHTFIQFQSATLAPGGDLTLVGHPATMVCGGPDDLHYDVAAASEVVHVPAGATVRVLTAAPAGIADTTIAHASLPSYLASDTSLRVFLITGPLSAITAIQEQYHP